MEQTETEGAHELLYYSPRRSGQIVEVEGSDHGSEGDHDGQHRKGYLPNFLRPHHSVQEYRQFSSIMNKNCTCFL